MAGLFSACAAVNALPGVGDHAGRRGVQPARRWAARRARFPPQTLTAPGERQAACHARGIYHREHSTSTGNVTNSKSGRGYRDWWPGSTLPAAESRDATSAPRRDPDRRSKACGSLPRHAPFRILARRSVSGDVAIVRQKVTYPKLFAPATGDRGPRRLRGHSAGPHRRAWVATRRRRAAAGGAPRPPAGSPLGARCSDRRARR